MIYVTQLMRPKFNANWDGCRKRHLKAVFAKQCGGIWIILNGVSMFRMDHINENVSGYKANRTKNERHYSCGWIRYTALPYNQRRIQTAFADLRQADDLLSAVCTYAGGY